jgi:hypothetical protein
MNKLMIVLAGVLASVPAFAVVQEVPEPASLSLLAMGVAAVAASRLRRK